MTTTIWPGAWAPEVRPARPAVASLYESAFDSHRPIDLATQLFDLTTVAGFPGSGG